MTIREWIREREINGFQTFSFEEVRGVFTSLSVQVVRNDLYRMGLQQRIVSVYNGFYVIIPPQYGAKGVIPPVYYIDQLMAFLGKPYYISLLNAAELLGAAHQRPQKFSVMTILPKASVSSTKNNLLSWVYRKTIPEQFMLRKNSETGIITFSSPELTALDLVQYEQYVGGLSRVTTVLQELKEQVDFSKSDGSLLECASIATIQRLGFILEKILEETKQADILYHQLKIQDGPFNYVSLSSRHAKKTDCKDKRWKIYINIDIETDNL